MTGTNRNALLIGTIRNRNVNGDVGCVKRKDLTLVNFFLVVRVRVRF